MVILTPAYGHDYKSKAKVVADLDGGKDFILNDITSQWDGKYCSTRDFKGQKVEVRYDNNRKVFIHECQ